MNYAAPLLIKGLHHLLHCNHYPTAEQKIITLAFANAAQGKRHLCCVLGSRERNIQLLLSLSELVAMPCLYGQAHN